MQTVLRSDARTAVSVGSYQDVADANTAGFHPCGAHQGSRCESQISRGFYFID